VQSYLPDFWERILIHGDLRVNPGTRIAIPMPDATDIGTSFHDFALKALLAKLVHEVDTTKTGADDQHIGFELFGIVLAIRDRCLVGRPNISRVWSCVRSRT
jgi:hypothetical protein